MQLPFLGWGGRSGGAEFLPCHQCDTRTAVAIAFCYISNLSLAAQCIPVLLLVVTRPVQRIRRLQASGQPEITSAVTASFHLTYTVVEYRQLQSLHVIPVFLSFVVFAFRPNRYLYSTESSETVNKPSLYVYHSSKYVLLSYVCSSHWHLFYVATAGP